MRCKATILLPSCWVLLAMLGGCELSVAEHISTEQNAVIGDSTPDTNNRYAAVGYLKSRTFSGTLAHTCSATWFRYEDSLPSVRGYLGTAGHCLVPESDKHSPTLYRYLPTRTTVNFHPTDQNNRDGNTEFKWGYTFHTRLPEYNIRNMDLGMLFSDKLSHPPSPLIAPEKSGAFDQLIHETRKLNEQWAPYEHVHDGVTELRGFTGKDMSLAHWGKNWLERKFLSPTLTFVGYGGRYVRHYALGSLLRYDPFEISSSQVNLVIGDSGGATLNENDELLGIIYSRELDKSPSASFPMETARDFFEKTDTAHNYCNQLTPVTCIEAMPLCTFISSDMEEDRCEVTPHSQRAWKTAQQYCKPIPLNKCVDACRVEDNGCVPTDRPILPFDSLACDVDESGGVDCPYPWPLPGNNYVPWFGTKSLIGTADDGSTPFQIYVLDLDLGYSTHDAQQGLVPFEELANSRLSYHNKNANEGYVVPVDSKNLVVIISENALPTFFDADARKLVEAGITQWMNPATRTRGINLLNLIRQQHQVKAFGAYKR